MFMTTRFLSVHARGATGPATPVQSRDRFSLIDVGSGDFVERGPNVRGSFFDGIGS